MAVSYIDEAEIKHAICLLKPENELFEVRIIPANRKQKPYVGYFKDADVLIRELKKQPLKGANVYITLQMIKEACYSREQRDCFVQGASTTSDNDIEGYCWLMIDLDPTRPSGVSSSEEELQKAKDLGNKIYQYLESLGFEKPFLGFSGNGVHLLYKVQIANIPEREELIKKCLMALDILFSTDAVKVDCSNFNPSRICKLYGTLAQKGANTADRPHRMSKVVSKAEEYKATDIQYLEKLCEVIPKEPDKPKGYNHYSPSDFDLEDWMYKHGLNYRKVNEDAYTKYVLEECPFDPEHTAPDASIFKMKNGAIGFHCFHRSCQFKTWQDVRIKYEPDAYEKKKQYLEKQSYKSFNRDTKPEPKVIEENDIPTEFTPKYMKNKPREIRSYIKTGFDSFDRKYIGLAKKQLTLLSGYSGGSKSTFLSQVMLNAVDQGNRVYCFSGELDSDDLYEWLLLQAAGKSNTEEGLNPGFYKVKDEVRPKILDWLDGKFWLYNNDKGYDFAAILDHITKKIRELKIDLVCIDNLMAMDISSLGDTKNDQQKAFVWQLHELAIKERVHIIVVCHPKKPTGLLTMYDVSGASEIVNAADNIIYVYRVTQQFKNAYKDYYKIDWTYGYTNVWHMAKARHGSITDDYVGMTYEPETKRLKDTLTDNRTYGWDNEVIIPSQWQIQY